MSGTFNDETGGHGGDLVRAARQWKQDGGDLLDFSSNINPLGPPEGLLEHLCESLPDIVNYPSPQARELREKIALFLNVPEEELLVGNGANELIHLLLLWQRPRQVLIPAPSFSEYERAAVLSGAAVERYSLLPGELFDPVALGSMLKEGDLLVICNPNNPTGVLYRRRDLLPLVEAAKDLGVKIMIDESFIPLTGHPEESLRDLQSENLWVTLSLTKLWSLPGLRLGCLIGPAGEVQKLTRWGDPWRVNILAQKAGLFCLKQKKYLEKTLALIEKERNFLTGRLLETGCFRVFEGAANYLLVQGTDPAFKVADFQDCLARQGVLIRRADNFYKLDQTYFRIAVRKRDENQRLIQEIENYVKKQYKNAKINQEAGGDQS